MAIKRQRNGFCCLKIKIILQSSGLLWVKITGKKTPGKDLYKAMLCYRLAVNKKKTMKRQSIIIYGYAILH